MKEVSKRLRVVFFICLAVEICIATLFESHVILEGGLCGDDNAEFLIMTFMQLLTVCIIPLALRLFKFEGIKRFISQRQERGLQTMALVRMMMLMIPMIANTICYYLFVKPGFGYLAIILAIALVFIYPSERRCESEL